MLPAGKGKLPRNGAKKGEKVPLLKPWKVSDEESRKKKGAPHRNCWHVFFGWLKYTFMPALIFLATSMIFMVGYHQSPQFLVLVSCFFILVLLSDSAYQFRAKNLGYQKGALGFALCAFAVFGGSIVGTSIDLTELVDYWPFYQMRHYTNVAPDEPAGSKADASVIVFMEGSRPDRTRVERYRRDGNTYCVAPIMVEAGYADGAAAASSDIQYWAVGQNCCSGKGVFTCDDAENMKARSGLVMQKLKGGDTIGEGIMSSDVIRYYNRAVTISLSKFDLTSPDDRIYVRFVQDIGATRMGYWTNAWRSWGFYQLGWLPLWILGGAMAVIIGAQDPDDPDAHDEHMLDARLSALQKLNHYI